MCGKTIHDMIRNKNIISSVRGSTYSREDSGKWTEMVWAFRENRCKFYGKESRLDEDK